LAEDLIRGSVWPFISNDSLLSLPRAFGSLRSGPFTAEFAGKGRRTYFARSSRHTSAYGKSKDWTAEGAEKFRRVRGEKRPSFIKKKPAALVAAGSRD